MHTHTRALARTYTHALSRAHTHTRARAHMHIHTDTPSDMYTSKNAYTQPLNINTQAQARSHCKRECMHQAERERKRTETKEEDPCARGDLNRRVGEDNSGG